MAHYGVHPPEAPHLAKLASARVAQRPHGVAGRTDLPRRGPLKRRELLKVCLIASDDDCMGRKIRRCLPVIGLLLVWIVAPSEVSAQTPAKADCEGKNPLYCGATERSEDGSVAVMPPGGCEGRNPTFCRETGAKVEAKKEAPKRKRRANADSRNEGRNPNPNPNSNPNRRSRQKRASQ